MIMIGLVAIQFTDPAFRHGTALALHQLVDYIDPHRVALAAPRSVDRQQGSEPERVIRVRADPRGHYYLNGTVNGVEFRFMIDTGATSIALPRGAVNQLGLSELRFDIPTMTAGGRVLNAGIKLKTLAVQSFVVADFPALVSEGGLEQALLGMSWLRLFRNVDIENGVMTLRY
jgi:aspartyl protease family protein